MGGRIASHLRHGQKLGALSRKYPLLSSPNQQKSEIISDSERPCTFHS